jgi:protein-S-isoprenylcysteine O-methyltransferase Ste14
LKLNLSTVAVAVFFVALFLFGRRSATWSASQIAGLAIFIPAFVLFLLARLQLGAAFSVRAKASSLVTSGLYARIRHPIYVFGAMMIIGFVLVMQRPWWLLIFVPVIPIQVIRVRKEEQVLEATFGDEYREYKRKTWF